MSNFDPFAPNNITSSGQSASYQNRSQVQAQYPSSTQQQNPTQQLVEYQVPGETQNQVQPQFQFGKQSQHQAQQQLQRPADVAQEHGRSLSLGRSKSLDQDPLKLNGRKKYSSSRSLASVESSRSGASGRYPPGQSPLDDPTFAPPPDPPADESFATRDRNNHAGSNNHANMPSFDMVKHSGNVMARISLKTIVTKKWKQIFWICYGDNKIIIFRSKSDFEEWALNPNLGDLDRNKLVKLSIDFPSATAGARGYRGTPLHEKDYGRKTGLMHTFKLEEWMYYGPVIIGAFASKNRTDAHTFLVVLRETMKRHKHDIASPSSVKSNQYNSEMSNRSVQSAPQPKEWDSVKF